MAGQSGYGYGSTYADLLAGTKIKKPPKSILDVEVGGPSPLDIEAQGEYDAFRPTRETDLFEGPIQPHPNEKPPTRTIKFESKSKGRTYEMPWDDPSRDPTPGEMKRHIYVTEQEEKKPSVRLKKAVSDYATNYSKGMEGSVGGARSGISAGASKLGELAEPITEPLGKAWDRWSNKPAVKAIDPTPYAEAIAQGAQDYGETKSAFDNPIEAANKWTARTLAPPAARASGTVAGSFTTPAGLVETGSIVAGSLTDNPALIGAGMRGKTVKALGDYAHLAGQLTGIGSMAHGGYKFATGDTWQDRMGGLAEAYLGKQATRARLGDIVDKGLDKTLGPNIPVHGEAPSAWPRQLGAGTPETPTYHGNTQGVSTNLSDLSEAGLQPRTPAQEAFDALVPNRYKPTQLQPENITRTVDGQPVGPLREVQIGESRRPPVQTEPAYPPGEAAPYKPTSKWPKKPTPNPEPAVREPNIGAKSRKGSGTILSGSEVGDAYGEHVSKVLKSGRIRALGPNKYGIETYEVLEVPTPRAQMTTEGLAPEGKAQIPDIVDEIPADAKQVTPTAPTQSVPETAPKQGPKPKMLSMDAREKELHTMMENLEKQGQAGAAKTIRGKLEKLLNEKGMKLPKKVDAVTSDKSLANDMAESLRERVAKGGTGEKGAVNIRGWGSVPGGLVKQASEKLGKAVKDITFEDIANLPRALQSGLDFSAPLRQGLPLIHKKEFRQALGPMFKSAVSDVDYQLTRADILTHPDYKTFEKAGGSITDLINKREENIISKIPGYIPGFKGSNRAYTIFLNKLRMDTFSNLLSEARKVDPKLDMKGIEQIAKFVNDATGRGEFGKIDTPGVSTLLSSIFFSPRLMQSRMSYANPANYFRLPKGVRAEKLKSLGAIGGFVATANGLAELADRSDLMNVKTTSTPTSSDFGKLKFGDVRLDVGGGFQQPLVLASRLGAGGYTNPTTRRFKTYGQGYGAQTSFDDIVDFGTSKLNPTLGFGVDAARASEYRPFNPSDKAMRLGTPLLAQDASELLQKRGLQPDVIAKILPAIFGVGMQQFDKYGEGTLLPKKVPEGYGIPFEGTRLPKSFRKELTRPQFWQKGAVRQGG